LLASVADRVPDARAVPRQADDHHDPRRAITLGTVLTAEGLLAFMGPTGWLNRVLMDLGIASRPVRFTHNYWVCCSR